MSVDRSELHEIIDELPDDDVARLLADARRRNDSSTPRTSQPFAWLAMGPSMQDGTDDARRIDDILAEGFGRD